MDKKEGMPSALDNGSRMDENAVGIRYGKPAVQRLWDSVNRCSWDVEFVKMP